MAVLAAEKRFAALALMLASGGCAMLEEPAVVGEPKPATVVAAAKPPMPAPTSDVGALAEEARALIAQAETDIQRARAKRALWSKAWESLVLARKASARDDPAGAARWARQASELAALGLEQLAYPAVK